MSKASNKNSSGTRGRSPAKKDDILNSMSLSQLKQVFTSQGKAFKSKSKRTDLIKELLEDSGVSVNFLKSGNFASESTSEGSAAKLSSSDSCGRRSSRNRGQGRSPMKRGVTKVATQNSDHKSININNTSVSLERNSTKDEKASKTLNVEARNGVALSTRKLENPRKKLKREISPYRRITEPNIKPMIVDKELLADTVIWKKPVTTVVYFLLESIEKLKELSSYLWLHRNKVCVLILLCTLIFALDWFDGPHGPLFNLMKQNSLWCVYWIFLGILSSVGLGTGLHTFLLYLGPHIASVTLAAFECNSVDFPSPPYPQEIRCPTETANTENVITIWTILSKVRLEAFMWGFGTALGELPPYFMARAARLSGTVDLDDELKELNELKERAKENPTSVPLTVRAKLQVEKLIERIGFPGILLMASIPNPLFDLAGITCGYLLVPFWQFFGATAIGKAIVKMHIQKIFVIISFSEHHAERFVSMIGKIPSVGVKLQALFEEFFESQKRKLHKSSSNVAASAKQSWLSWIFDKLVLAMVIYFVVSIINSMAQNYKRKIEDEEKRKASTFKSRSNRSLPSKLKMS